MFCTNCGSQQDDSVKFCGSCGNALGGSVPAAPAAPAAQPAQSFQPAQPAPMPGTYSAPPPASGIAIAALVLAFFFPIVGLILGYVAKNDIRNSRGTKGGDGMATAAIALGWIFTAIGVIWIIVAVSTASMYRYY